MVIKYFLTVTICYLLGSINPSYICAKKIANIDIRQAGSHNAGTTNTIFVLGWKYGILCGLFDIFKGFAAVCWVKIVYNGNISLMYAAALSVILGHIFPVFLRFRGGKGLATLFGSGLGLSTVLTLAMLASLIVITAVTDYMVIGVAAADTAFSVYSLLKYGLSLPFLFSLIVAGTMIAKHTPNYARIAAGGAGEVKMSFFIKQRGHKPDDLDSIDNFKDYKY